MQAKTKVEASVKKAHKTFIEPELKRVDRPCRRDGTPLTDLGIELREWCDRVAAITGKPRKRLRKKDYERVEAMRKQMAKHIERENRKYRVSVCRDLNSAKGLVYSKLS